MGNVFFYLACACVASVPSGIWLALFLEYFELPALGWFGAALIFWLFFTYMVTGSKEKRDVQDWYERD